MPVTRYEITMHKLLTTCLLLLLLALPSGAQEERPAGDTTTPAETGADTGADTAAGTDTAKEADDSDLDEQTYDKDDDDFVPTEEIPADEPIPFPSNI
jgi:hypothetical protein